jgi:uncharacterized membrane protein
MKRTASKHADKPTKKSSMLHLGFEIALMLKGLHAALEIVGGVLLWFLRPDTLNRWIRVLTQNELIEDPRDVVANLVVRAGQHYTISTQHFGEFYLLSHGLVKVVLVLLLWRRKLWAYPLAVVVLVLFIAYQVLRWTSTHSAFLIFLSALDAFIIWLTLSEYGRLKAEAPTVR